MTCSRLLAAIALAALPAAPALAEDDFQQWLTLSARVDASDSVAIQNELVARLSDDRGGLYEIENSLLIGYRLSKSVTAWAGYVHNPQYDGGYFTGMEHRAREQLTIDNFARIGSASLSARVRLEQRWRDGVNGTAWRARPYVKLGVPLGDKSAPTLNLTAEPFFNLNTTDFQEVGGLDRLRSAISLTVPVAEAVRIEAGYLNQHRFVRGRPDVDEHALTASLAFTF